MAFSPRVRVPGVIKYKSFSREKGVVEHSADHLFIRDVVRIVFFIPYDNFQIAAGVSHALDSYLQAVKGYPNALAHGRVCWWEFSRLTERTWQLIRDALAPQEHKYIEDYTREEAFYPEKDGADPYFDLRPEPGEAFGFSYYARIPSREQEPNYVSVLSAILPTEFLDQHGPERVRELALEMSSRLPFASGHAGLALALWKSVSDEWDRLRPVVFNHPGFDLRDVNIRDNPGTRVGGVHWLNFLGQPVLGELGGASGLRARLQCPTTTVQELNGERVLVSLGPEPEAGDLAQGQPLPAYRELARVLEPWQEPFPWRHWPFKDSSVKEELRRWWRRFLD
ncbi:hypothetical protein DAT35_39250 [Vitiosangium sp. GDMCC 1.1324]|nr:hypothetical protein DAT35_39250 [Vitiosangium sp. GDMCC 1.1324]